jgi:hypothetical protein
LPFFIFFGYLLLTIVLIINIPFFKKTNLGSPWLVGLFLSRILAGVAYGYIHAHPPPHIGLTDTWKFFNESLPETALLKLNPSAFIQDLLPNNSTGFHLFSTQHNYWNNIKFTLMVKLAAVFNLFSFGNYYVNLIFYNFLCFVGSILLFQVLEEKLKNKFLSIGISFLIPSVAFWGSGFHKEGLILTSLSALIFYVEKLVITKRYVLLFPTIFFLFLLLLLRTNILFALLPALLGWILSMKHPNNSLKLFLAVNILSSIFFFTSKFLFASIDIPKYVAERQWEFIQLQGKTMVQVPKLQPNFEGFVQNFPSAVNMAFVRPYLGEGGIAYIPFFVETFLIVIITILGIVLLVIKKEKLPIFFMFCLNFSILLLLIIGYTIPNVGAIIRYKSIALPFLLVSFMPLFIKLFYKKQIH